VLARADLLRRRAELRIERARERFVRALAGSERHFENAQRAERERERPPQHPCLRRGAEQLARHERSHQGRQRACHPVARDQRGDGAAAERVGARESGLGARDAHSTPSAPAKFTKNHAMPGSSGAGLAPLDA
jgi:hypothetical protein